MSSLKKLLLQKGYQCIPLRSTSTDHFEVKASINGKKGRFILDTGASNSCVGFDEAQRFGLQPETSEIKAAGAGAIDMETQVSVKNKLQLGPLTLKKVKIVLIDLSHVNQALTKNEARAVNGILGADVLRKLNGVIDYRKNRLFIRKK